MAKNKLQFIFIRSIFIAAFAQLLFAGNAHAQLTTTRKGNYASMTYLVNKVLLGSGITATNITYQGIDTSFGFFNGIKSNVGMDTGLVITNGGIGLAAGPNQKANDKSNSNGWTTYNESSTDGWPNSNTYEDVDLANLIGTTTSNTYSCAILQFDFIAPTDSVEFQYVFGSNEEPCWVTSAYVDDFGFFLSGPGINGPGGINGAYTNNAENLALIPGSNNAVYIKNVNCTTNSAYWVCNYPSNAAGCPGTCTTGCPASTAVTTVGYNGFTTVLTAKAKVECGQKYHIKLGVADIGNGEYDSGVFLKGGSFKPTTKPMAVSSTASSTCSGSPVTITATGATSYTWSPASSLSATTGTNVVATPTTNTTYTVIGNISGACNDTLTVPITINAGPTITATATSSSICSGNSSTLNATGAGTGGTYSWSNGTTGSSISVSPTTSTTYTVTGTASPSGCINKGTVVVTVVATPTVGTISILPVTAICSGQSATLQATGGTTYTWSTGQTGSSISVTPPVGTNTYSVIATASGCSSTSSPTATVTVNPTPTLSISPAPSATICQGTSTKLSAGGAGANATYTWTPGSSLTNTTFDTTTAYPSGTTVYTLTATTALGCTNTTPATLTVTVNPSPTVSLSVVPSPTICSGSSVILKASGASTYTWSPSIAATTSTVSVSPSSTKTYTVTGNSALGCNNISNSTQTMVVTVVTTPTVSILQGVAVTICPGDSLTLNAQGGSPGSYTWSTGKTTDSIVVKPSSTTTYSVTSTNGACPATTPYSIAVNVGAINVVVTSSTGNTICSGTSSVLSASGASSYSWSTGATGSSITVSPTTTTTYTVIGQGGSNSCQGTATYPLNVNTSPTITVTNNSATGTVCPRDTTQAYVTVTGAGTPVYTYNWSTVPSQNSDTAYGLKAGTYTVSISDANHCISDTATVKITTQNIIVTATAKSTTFCAGDSTLIVATGATNYIWSNGATSSTITIHATTDSIFTVWGTTTGTCKDSASDTIKVNPLPINISPTSSAGNTICSNSTGTTLSATGASSYIWMPDGLSGNSVNVNPSDTTKYTVIGTSAAGCIDSSSITINVNPTPTITISLKGTGGDTLCPGKSITLIANGGNTSTSYLWSNGSTTTSITISPSQDTTFSVVASNGPCAGATVIQPVFVYPQLNVSIISNSSCIGRSDSVAVIATGGKPGYTYSWSNSITGTSSITIVPTTTTSTISCDVTDGCGTSINPTATVTAYPAPVIKFTAVPTSILAGQFVAFLDSTINATNYAWNFGNGTTSSSFSPYVQYLIASNEYYVTLIASNAGCSDTARDSIHVTNEVIIPNVFTPNGDGINDVFHITMTDAKEYHIEIFNRWGEKVFMSDSPNIDWTGRSMSGVEESDGTYYYIITAISYDNQSLNHNGYVQLIRGN